MTEFLLRTRRVVVNVGALYALSSAVLAVVTDDYAFFGAIAAEATFLVATAFLLGASSDGRVEAVRGDGGTAEG